MLSKVCPGRLETDRETPGISEVSTTEQGIAVSWSNGHESHFPHRALYRASYDPPLSPPIHRPLETADHKSPPVVMYGDVMTDEAAVLEWLNRVVCYIAFTAEANIAKDRFGFCFVKEVPPTAEDTEGLIRRIAHIRETHYGGFWDFTADMSHGDLAYSNLPLPAHTDTTYFTDPAGLQIFHLLSHDGEGGSSLLVDGFAAARQLSKESYRTLSRLAVPAHASGSQGQLLRPHDSPVLRHDAKGNLIQICWNNEDRGVLGQGWTPAEVADWYRSAREYEGLLRQHEYWIQLEPSTVVGQSFAAHVYTLHAERQSSIIGVSCMDEPVLRERGACVGLTSDEMIGILDGSLCRQTEMIRGTMVGD